ncbi:hypothetical protein AB1K83_00615 [Sporosarcina sp. 179-K 3D1 HS]|uniref:DUF7010 family protein n=1 Tax=Sporosarcina sp. 179-K 3D1 HS TaxID=3232169 RepID=UPI00399F0B23
MRNRLSVVCKNGVGFLLSATVIWMIILALFMSSLDITVKNIGTLWATGLMFPVAILFSKLIQAEWKASDNPIGQLGFIANLAQLMYFPILAWAFLKSPEQLVLFFAIVTGAHFFPYGWVYNTKAYYVMAPVMAVTLIVVGWEGGSESLWRIPLVMVISLAVLNAWLWVDYKKKSQLDAG